MQNVMTIAIMISRKIEHPISILNVTISMLLPMVLPSRNVRLLNVKTISISMFLPSGPNTGSIQLLSSTHLIRRNLVILVDVGVGVYDCVCVRRAYV